MSGQQLEWVENEGKDSAESFLQARQSAAVLRTQGRWDCAQFCAARR